MLRIRDLANAHFGPVTLDIAGGECIAIHGASGAGKSVFLRAIVDLDENTGTIAWQHQQRADAPAPDWRRLVAYVPAETGWWADQVASHFAAGIELGDDLQSLGLPADALDWDVTRLSTGERHRLGLLRTFVSEPPVMLLDEPTASLDAATTAAIEMRLRQHLARGAALILVTHDPAQAERLATRIFTMVAGKLIPAQSSPASGSENTS